MSKNRYLFFLRVYNDIDHLVPIIFKMHRSGYGVDIVLIDKNRNVVAEKDERLQCLERLLGRRIGYYYSLDESPVRLLNKNLTTTPFVLWNKFMKFALDLLDRVIFNGPWALRILTKKQPLACIFDIQELDAKTMEGKFMMAAQKLHIPIIAVPHGLNVYTNYECNENRRAEPLSSEELSDAYGLDIFDVVAEQNPDQIGMLARTGFAAERIRVLGSARFCAEWIKVCGEIYPPYLPVKPVLSGAVKVVFFLPHWDHFVDQKELLSLLLSIADLDRVFMVIKEHTREGAGDMPADLREKLSEKPNVEMMDNPRSFSLANLFHEPVRVTPSFSLTRWTDMVINLGSSVGLDALQLGRLLINPKYLHQNTTIFDDYHASLVVQSKEELLAAILLFQKGKRDLPYNPRECLQKAVYGGEEDRDVLRAYCEMIASFGKSDRLEKLHV